MCVPHAYARTWNARSNQRSERCPHPLDDPDTRAHRFAVKLARIAARNARANEPRLFGIRARDSHRLLNRGQRFIRTGMELVMPLIEDRLAAWIEGFEPA
jgi:hypothetical protein